MQVARTAQQDDSDSDSDDDPEVKAMKAQLQAGEGAWKAHNALVKAGLEKIGSEVHNYFGTLANQVQGAADEVNRGMHDLASAAIRSQNMAKNNANQAIKLAGDQHTVLSTAHESLKQGHSDISKTFSKGQTLLQHQQDQLERQDKIIAAQDARLRVMEAELAALKGMSSLSMQDEPRTTLSTASPPTSSGTKIVPGQSESPISSGKARLPLQTSSGTTKVPGRQPERSPASKEILDNGVDKSKHADQETLQAKFARGNQPLGGFSLAPPQNAMTNLGIYFFGGSGSSGGQASPVPYSTALGQPEHKYQNIGPTSKGYGFRGGYNAHTRQSTPDEAAKQNAMAMRNQLAGPKPEPSSRPRGVGRPTLPKEIGFMSTGEGDRRVAFCAICFSSDGWVDCPAAEFIWEHRLGRFTDSNHGGWVITHFFGHLEPQFDGALCTEIWDIFPNLDEIWQAQRHRAANCDYDGKRAAQDVARARAGRGHKDNWLRVTNRHAKTQEMGPKRAYVPPAPRPDHGQRMHAAAGMDYTQKSQANAEVLDQNAKEFAAARRRDKANRYVHVEGLRPGSSSFSGPMPLITDDSPVDPRYYGTKLSRPDDDEFVGFDEYNLLVRQFGLRTRHIARLQQIREVSSSATAA
jgi:hypothetical protein